MKPAPAEPGARPEVGAANSFREVWALLCGTGLGLCVLGFLAGGASFVASLATETVFGVLLLFGAVLEMTNTFWAYRWKGFAPHLVAGVLYLIVGVFLIEHPTEATNGLTLLVACCFLVSGVLRMALSVVERFEGWVWTLGAGIGSFVMGVILLCQWPIFGLWVIGLFVGIEMFSSGVAWIVLGLAVRLAAPRTPRPLARTLSE